MECQSVESGAIHTHVNIKVQAFVKLMNQHFLHFLEYNVSELDFILGLLDLGKESHRFMIYSLKHVGGKI